MDLRNLTTVAGSFGVIASMGAAAFTGTRPEARVAGGRLEVDTTGNGAADFALLMPGGTMLTPGFADEILL